MCNKSLKQSAEPQKEFSNSFQDSREVFDQQCNNRACNCTEERIKKLESSVRLLTSFLIGHLVGELLSKIFFS